MSRLSHRLVALLLVPCLLADSGTASALHNPLSPTWERVQGEGGIFVKQALAERLFAYSRGNFLKGFGLIKESLHRRMNQSYDQPSQLFSGFVLTGWPGWDNVDPVLLFKIVGIPLIIFIIYLGLSLAKDAARDHEKKLMKAIPMPETFFNAAWERFEKTKDWEQFKLEHRWVLAWVVHHRQKLSPRWIVGLPAIHDRLTTDLQFASQAALLFEAVIDDDYLSKAREIAERIDQVRDSAQRNSRPDPELIGYMIGTTDPKYLLGIENRLKGSDDKVLAYRVELLAGIIEHHWKDQIVHDYSNELSKRDPLLHEQVMHHVKRRRFNNAPRALQILITRVENSKTSFSRRLLGNWVHRNYTSEPESTRGLPRLGDDVKITNKMIPIALTLVTGHVFLAHGNILAGLISYSLGLLAGVLLLAMAYRSTKANPGAVATRKGTVALFERLEWTDIREVYARAIDQMGFSPKESVVVDVGPSIHRYEPVGAAIRAKRVIVVQPENSRSFAQQSEKLMTAISEIRATVKRITGIDITKKIEYLHGSLEEIGLPANSAQAVIMLCVTADFDVKDFGHSLYNAALDIVADGGYILTGEYMDPYAHDRFRNIMTKREIGWEVVLGSNDEIPGEGPVFQLYQIHKNSPPIQSSKFRRAVVPVGIFHGLSDGHIQSRLSNLIDTLNGLPLTSQIFAAFLGAVLVGGAIWLIFPRFRKSFSFEKKSNLPKPITNKEVAFESFDQALRLLQANHDNRVPFANAVQRLRQTGFLYPMERVDHVSLIDLMESDMELGAWLNDQLPLVFFNYPSHLGYVPVAVMSTLDDLLNERKPNLHAIHQILTFSYPIHWLALIDVYFGDAGDYRRRDFGVEIFKRIVNHQRHRNRESIEECLRRIAVIDGVAYNAIVRCIYGPLERARPEWFHRLIHRAEHAPPGTRWASWVERYRYPPLLDVDPREHDPLRPQPSNLASKTMTAS